MEGVKQGGRGGIEGGGGRGVGGGGRGGKGRKGECGKAGEWKDAKTTGGGEGRGGAAAAEGGGVGGCKVEGETHDDGGGGEKGGEKKRRKRRVGENTREERTSGRLEAGAVGIRAKVKRGKGKTDGGGGGEKRRGGKEWNREKTTETREMEERGQGGGGGAHDIAGRGGIVEEREMEGRVKEGGREGMEDEGRKGGGGGGHGGGKGRKEKYAKAGEWKEAKTTGGGEGRGGAEAPERETDGVAERGGKGEDRAERIEGGGGNVGERTEKGEGGGESKGKGAERGEGGGKERKKIKEGVQTTSEGSGTGAEKKGTAGNGEGRFSPGNTAAAEADKAAKSRQNAKKQKSRQNICHGEAQRGRDKRTRGAAAAIPAPEEGAEKEKEGIICGESEGAVHKEEENVRREEKGSRKRHQEGEEGQGETECIKGRAGGIATGKIGGAGKGVEENRNKNGKRRQGEETENKGGSGGRIGMCGGRWIGRGKGEELGKGGGAPVGGGGEKVNGGRDRGRGGEQGEKVDDGGRAGGGKEEGEKKGGQMKGAGGGEERGDVTVKSKGNEVSGAVADREGGIGVHGAAGQRAQEAGPERNAFPPGDVQDSAACLAGGVMDHRVPTPAEPRKTLQTATQTQSQSSNAQGKKLTRRSGSARSDVTHSARGKHENTWTAKIPLLLLFCTGIICQLACVGAGPVSVSLHMEGWGRTLQGENYSLVCEVTPPLAAHTSPAFSWYRDGTLLDNQTGRVLNLYPLSKRDEGDNRCGLKTENGARDQLSDLFTLHVLVLEKISLVPEVEVEEGQTVILNCSVHSDPTAFLTWRLGDKTVHSVRSNSDSLVLHNAWQYYHLQVVKCEAYNNELGFLDAYSLIRRKGTYEVVSTPQLGQRGVPVLHRPFGMECLVTELPNQGVNVHLTYTWYKDDKVMEGQSDMILDFPSLRKEDSGLYTCTARNGKPRTTSPQSNASEVVSPPWSTLNPGLQTTSSHRLLERP